MEENRTLQKHYFFENIEKTLQVVIKHYIWQPIMQWLLLIILFFPTSFIYLLVM